MYESVSFSEVRLCFCDPSAIGGLMLRSGTTSNGNNGFSQNWRRLFTARANGRPWNLLLAIDHHT